MRESLLVFGAVTILSVITLSINRMVVRSTEQVLDNEAHHAAIALTQQLMDRIAGLSFDEKTVGGKSISMASDLTPVVKLGSDSSKTSVSLYDDIDDFQNVTLSGDSTRYPGFRLHVRVVYADTANPLNNANTQTLLKRITVLITNPNYLSDPDTRRLSYILGYY